MIKLKPVRFLAIAVFCFFSFTSNAQWVPGVFGYKIDEQEHVRPKTRGSSLPSSTSIKGYAPAIGDQGMYGTCVGWATAYAGMTILENIALDRPGDSTNMEDCFSPQFIYDVSRFPWDTACSEGLYTHEALENLKTIGIAKISEYDYVCRDVIEEYGIERTYEIATSSNNSIGEFLSEVASRKLEGFIPLHGANLVDNVKYYLSQQKPVVVAVEMYSSITHSMLTDVWSGEIDYWPGGHALCVVGYDDNKYGGAFEILNSWGDDWGNDGYIWFRYTDFAKAVDKAYALTGIVSEKKEHAVHDYYLDIKAIGKESRKNCYVAATSNDNARNGIGSLTFKYTYTYPEDETGIQLGIDYKNTDVDTTYVYGFDMVGSGDDYISLITSLNPAQHTITSESNVMFIPADQGSYIEMSNGWYSSGNDIALLFCQEPLSVLELQKLLGRKYASLDDFLLMNFSTELAAVQPMVSDGNTLSIIGYDEINPIVPVMLKFEKEETIELSSDLFTSINYYNIDDFSTEYDIESVLYRFESTFSSPSIEINIVKKLISLPDHYYLSCIVIDESEEDWDDYDDLSWLFESSQEVDVPSSTFKKKKTRPAFTFTFNTEGEDFEDDLYFRLVEALGKAKIDFRTE